MDNGKDKIENIFQVNNSGNLQSATTSKLGGVPLYTITNTNGEKVVVPIPQDINYAYKGQNLVELSLLEYCCIIEGYQQQSSKEETKH
mgnify:CR=1 FL=1